MKSVPPITIELITPEWIELRREIIAREGHAVRAGEVGVGQAGPYTIELKSLRTNEWGRIMLPGGATAFTSAADRDAVLRQLQGESSNG